MKRLWIVLGIIMMILIVSLLGIWHLTTSTKVMQEALNEISIAVEQKKGGQAEALTAEFQELWHKNERMYSHYIHLEALDAINGAVARLNALARYEDYAELAAEVERIWELINHIRESEMPTWRNIF